MNFCAKKSNMHCHKKMYIVVIIIFDNETFLGNEWRLHFQFKLFTGEIIDFKTIFVNECNVLYHLYF